MNTVTRLGTLNLIVSDNGAQKIELVPSKGVDILALIGINKYDIIPGIVSDNFQVYFEELLQNLNLSQLHIYRQRTYFGLRLCSTNETLIYWNSNNRVRYVNINLKESVLAPIASLVEQPLDADTRFSNTRRIRLHNKEQVDSFFEVLKPVLIRLDKNTSS